MAVQKLNLKHYADTFDGSQGASPKELIFEACRRNNVDLLSETLQPFPHGTRAQLLNNSRDGIGNYPLHVAATYGSCSCRLPLPPLRVE